MSCCRHKGNRLNHNIYFLTKMSSIPSILLQIIEIRYLWDICCLSRMSNLKNNSQLIQIKINQIQHNTYIVIYQIIRSAIGIRLYNNNLKNKKSTLKNTPPRPFRPPPKIKTSIAEVSYNIQIPIHANKVGSILKVPEIQISAHWVGASYHHNLYFSQINTIRKV